ncbi:DUF11 domain-containing protein [Thalassococcus sp. CAU 1522]|uniref:DUF11 domain-containing protein n=1 Tax=Thalassococcus arenae TaxID=2851652 RepID=A0ABS6NB26_9RHOB|nr:DUF11 domain-containing protein [Thalassococcus arenae]MBV2360789.1 DUF11 domain-containing protein [Thalassococcus arenae]
MFEGRRVLSGLCRAVGSVVCALVWALVFWGAGPVQATTFTTTVPGTSIRLPSDYPQAGGVAFVLVGNNGNLYFQFSDPTGAFVGFQNRGRPARFRGNPFTINDPLTLNCGFSSCSDYFGGGLSAVHIRFSAFDGDTQQGGFDEGDISLILNGFNVGSWSGLTTEATNDSGTVSFGFGVGFGNQTFDTGWFTSTNPALLSNILSTGQTTTQVFDRDPNDNYWDFTRGPSLQNIDIVTVAPGYTLEKTASAATYTTAGETVDFTYVVTNIGSVPIRSLAVADDKIASVTCDKTVILDVNPGQTPDFATCTGTYTVTQEDVDNQSVTNIAVATGVPDHGTLGARQDSVTLTGPAPNPVVAIEKTSTLSAFGAVGTPVPYAITVRNDGNVTLGDVTVTDPLTGLNTVVTSLAPGDETVINTSYTVRQSDIDGFATSGTTLDNTASVTAEDPNGTDVTDSAGLTLPGPTPVVSMDLTKTALTAGFDSIGDVLSYQIRIVNTGTVTFPGPPAITDALTGGATCPAGAIPPGNAVVCTASYAVDQDDINAGQVENTASAEIVVGGLTASDSDTASVTATRTVGLSLDKRLAAASPTTFAATGVVLQYEYVLRNTGNVTLLNPAVADDRTAVTCPGTEILPGTQMVCTASYSTVQGDLDAGEVVNTATASATEAGPTPNPVSSGADQVTVPAVQNAAMTLAKTAPTLTPAEYQLGETITYSFEVTNSGNVTLNTATTGGTEITVTDDKIGSFTCDALPLAVGASVTCTADYVLTSDDIVANSVQNRATANAGSVTSNEDTALVSPSFSPAIGVAKSSPTASVAATSDSIAYEFLVTNTGNTQILLPDQPVTISDALLSATADCSAQPATLDAGDSFTCTGTRTGVTQAELDAGSVDNSATASFPFVTPGGTITVTSDVSTASVPVVPAPSMTFAKDGPAQFAAVGEQLDYTFTVTNTGNVTLASVTVTDPLIPGLSCTLTGIAPGDNDSCTGAYFVTQADLDAEQIDNTATATAQPAQGAQFSETATESVPVDPLVPSKSASITKVASTASFASVGQQITYTMQVTNTGTQTLTGLAVTDVLDAGFSCTIPTLAPGATDTSCSFLYTVTQDDLDAGQIDNTATVDSPDITAAVDSETVNGPARVAAFTFDKRAPARFTSAGQSIDFVFEVRNTGNVTLSNVTVTDPFFGSPVNCVIGTLLPGEVDSTTCTTAYTIGQGDIDAGSLTNTATASADAPAGVAAPADVDDSVTVAGPAENASVTITKTPADGVFASATDTEGYTFEVENSGNVTLTGLVITDDDLGFTCALDDLLPGDSTTQCADTTPLSATKAFSQADVDAGSYTNTATVTGQSAVRATPVADSATVTVTGPAQAPALSLAKTATLAGTFDTLGQSLTYEFDVTNIGNITITAPVVITDSRIGTVSCPALPAGGLAPLASLTCTASDTVTQADLDAGQVTNTATASAEQTVVPANPGDPSTVTVTSNSDAATVTADQLPALGIDKRVKAGSPSSFDSVGDTIVFEYVVTNTGNVTTTADVTVDDDRIPGTLTCSTAPLAPGASVTCEQTWTAAQADLDAGTVTNIATADTVFDGSPVQSAPDSVSVNAVQDPSLAVVKTFTGTDNPGFFNVGDTLSYEIVVSNDGNVTVDAPITLTDNLATPICPAVPGGALEPGDTLTCTSSHVVTSNDIDLGSATNVVFATGSFDGSPVRSPSDNAIYPVDADPALSVVKVADPADTGFDAAGDTITYTYTVTNSGNVGLSDAITIEDDKMGTLACRPAAGGGTPVFASGASHDCSFDYTVTQADVDRGFVTNNAVAKTVYAPGGASTDVTSPNASETVSADELPGLTVAKDMTDTGIATASAGDVLPYTIIATNSGNQTLRGVAITDPLIPSLSCDVVPVAGAASAAPANVVLLPGEALRCAGTYTVTQADLDAQTLVNTASAAATDPQGASVGATGGHSQPLDAPVTAMVVTKTVDPDPGAGAAFAGPGEPVTFRIAVRNTGNITLSQAVVTDERPVTPTSCTTGPIAPGATDTSCEFTYVVTQADIDAINTGGGATFGGFTNTANVTATPDNPSLPDFTGSGSVFVRGPDRDPQLRLAKSADLAQIDTWNQLVTYTYTVVNTGNVTLTEVPQITDDKIGTFACAGLPSGGLLPSDFYQCTASYTVTQADLDSGGVTNTATVTSSEVAPGDPQATDALTIPAARSPGLSLVKTPSVTAGATEGQEITYSYTVTNTGNVTISDVTVSDQHTSAAGTVALAVGGDTLTTDINETGTSVDSDGDGVWTTLAPGDVVTFTAAYTVTQADVDAQADLTNIAQVTGNDPDNTALAPVQAGAAVSPIVKAPALAVTKTADDTAIGDPATVGDIVTFEIVVENTGNVTLTAPVLTDTLTDADGGSLTLSNGPDFSGGDTDSDGNLSIGERWVYTADFAIDQQAIDAGGVSNTVSVVAQDPQGVDVPDDLDTPAIVDLGEGPALAVVKSASLDDGGDGRADVGDVITYTYVVTNTGNQTLFDVAVAETGFGGAGAVPTPVYESGGADLDGQGDAADLAVGGGTVSFTATYALTQDDIDAGSVANQATASAADPNGDPVSDLSGSTPGDDAATQTPLTAAGALQVVKTAAPVLSSPPAIGDVIDYTITVRNIGNVTLTDVVLTDTLRDADGTVLTPAPVPVFDGTDTGTAGALDVGEVWTYTAQVVLTAEMLDSGGVTNSVTATATDPVDGPVSDVSDDSADAPGDSDPTATELTRAPALAVVKASSFDAGADEVPSVGDVITYTYTITNTGNVTLFDLGVAETGFGGAGTTPIPVYDSGGADLDAEADAIDLAVGGGAVTFTATYALTQADIDAGAVSNQATGTGVGPDGTPTSDVSGDAADTDAPTLTELPAAPALSVVKTADTGALSDPAAAGEVVSFDIAVANTGNVTLDNVVLTDTLRRADGTVLTLPAPPALTGGDGGIVGLLEVGETWTYTLSHTLTQADIDAGGLSNQVRVIADTPGDGPIAVSSDDGVPGNGTTNPTLVEIDAAPGIEAVKELTGSDVVAGSLLSYEITLTNTGNVTLTGVGIASEDLERADGTALSLDAPPAFGGGSLGSPQGTLRPGETATYTAQYTLQQADIDAGGVRNSVTGRGTPPSGPAVTDVSDDNDDGDGNTTDDPAELLIPADPSLRLAKTLAATAPASFSATGVSVGYVFTLTNTGNVTLTEAPVIDDPFLADAGVAVTCPTLPAQGLIPGAELVCTADYETVQADIDAGGIDNTATATSGTPDGTVVSDPSTVSLPAVQAPAIDLVKTAASIDAADFVVGATVSYSYVVSNDGNVTITEPITVTDNLIPAADMICPAFPVDGLTPGDSYTCTADYTVTVDDVDLGSVTNLAGASDGTTDAPLVGVTIPNEGIPALSVTKTAEAGASFAAVGDEIDYTFTVTNTGTRAFVAPVVIRDTELGEIACFTPTTADPDFTAGEVATCSATHVVTQADLDAGEIVNDAFAETTFGAGDTMVTSPPVSETVAADAAPELTLAKSVATLPVTGAGQVLTYTLEANNSGNQTLRAITISDPLLPGLTCSAATLAPGEALSCDGDYTVRQSDIDTGSLVNTASVSGVAPNGDPVRDETVLTTAMPAAAPGLTLVKTAVPSPFGGVGSTLSYRFTVTNTGNVTLTGLTVSELLDPDYRCEIATLAPGAVNRACGFSIPVTQAMVDAGSIDNSATVTGLDPFDGPVTATAEVTTDGPAQVAALEATKVLAPVAPVAGAVLSYTLSVENTGNVTLSNVDIVDTMQTLDGRPIMLDAPFALIAASDTDNDGELDVGETWLYSAQYTLQQADINEGGVSNRVTATAEDPGAGVVSDASDDGRDGDGNTSDDPTVLTIDGAPSLSVTKRVTSSGNLVGETVVFEIAALNTGNVDLTDLSVTDLFERADGASLVATPIADDVPASLSPGETATWTLSHEITQADVDAGGLVNSAVVSARDPDGGPVSDLSADDDPLDGNTTDDPTELTIAPVPELTVIKQVTEVGAAAGDTVSYAVTVRNTGTVTLTGVTVSDALTDLDGGNPRALPLVFTGADGSPASPEGTLLPGETATYTASATLTLADIDSGGLSNTVTATGTTPRGGSVTDISDDDGTGDSDPTIAEVTPLPSFDIVKTVSEPRVVFPTIYEVDFTIAVTNTGNLTQTGIQVTDDLVSFLSPALLLSETYPVEVTASGFADGSANGAYDGDIVTALLSGDATLAPGGSGTITVTLTYATATGQPGAPNTAAVTSDQLGDPTEAEVALAVTDEDGDGIPDNLESATADRDGDGIPDAEDYDPTGYFYCEEDGRILTGGQITVSGGGFSQTGTGVSGPIVIIQDGSLGFYQFHVTAPGTYTLTLDYPGIGTPSTTRLPGATLDATSLLPDNPAALGSGEFGATGVLADFAEAANPFHTAFAFEAGDPFIINNNLPLTACAGVPDVVATKTADRETAVFGETVNYTLSFRNDTLNTYAGAQVVDRLPVGLNYTPGTARIDGVAVDPVVSGRTLVWTTDLAASATAVLTYSVRVARQGGFGERENRAYLQDAFGRRLSNVARAVVRIDPEHVFDCSDVIGKVFDDRNGNGYQDGPDSLPAQIIDRDYIAGADGKGGKAAVLPVQPETVNRDEPGIPDVRLVTPNGLIITTDEFGRFSVPCAALPRDIGSNFQLKLDTRTLPSGYRVTTENPRNIRLTAGKLAKLNFGASLSNLVNIDLADRAFAPGQADASPALDQALDGLLGQIADTPSTIRLTYVLEAGEGPELGRARLRVLEQTLKRKWRGTGRYKLIIERQIVRSR